MQNITIRFILYLKLMVNFVHNMEKSPFEKQVVHSGFTAFKYVKGTKTAVFSFFSCDYTTRCC